MRASESFSLFLAIILPFSPSAKNFACEFAVFVVLSEDSRLCVCDKKYVSKGQSKKLNGTKMLNFLGVDDKEEDWENK